MAGFRPRNNESINRLQKIPTLIDAVKASGKENTTLTEYLDELSEIVVPDTYKSGREGQLKLAKALRDRDLFTESNEKESGDFILYGTEGDFSPVDFIAFRMGITKLLYNQSYQMGNADILSGLKREEAVKVTYHTQKTTYAPIITFSLNDLCRAGYGELTHEQRKKQAAIIQKLRVKDYRLLCPNGDILEIPVINQLARYTRKRDGAIYYILQLNPLWNDMAKGWAEIPQDYSQRLAALPIKRTEALLLLSELLLHADKRKPLHRYIATLLEELQLTEAYRKDAKRTEEQLLSYFEAMITTGAIKSYEVEKGKVKRRIAITKVTFHFDPSFKKWQNKPTKGGKAKKG